MFKTLKSRVALWSCVTSGIVLLVVSGGMIYQAKLEFSELVDRNLEDLAISIIEGAKKNSYDRDPFRDYRIFDPGSYQREIYEQEDRGAWERNVTLLAIRKPDGIFSFQNKEYWNDVYQELLEANPWVSAGPFLSDSDRDSMLILPNALVDRWEIRMYRKHGYSVYLGVNHRENKDEYWVVLKLGLYAVPIALVVIAVGGWWTGAYAVNPIKDMSRVVASIKVNDLAKRLPNGAQQNEIKELTRQVNDMLERIEIGYTRANRFSADASHEIRTPLAILQIELESRIRNSSGEDAIDLNRILEEIRRMKTLLHSLLFLSKTDSSNLKIEKDKLDFSSLVSHTLDDIEDLYSSTDLSFDRSKIEPEIVLTGDDSLIRQAVMNLLRNAAKYNRVNGKLSCSVYKRDRFACVLVGNTGPAIPAESREKVFDRFYRVDERGKSGFGLGLNIVREIAKYHGGEVDLLEGKPDWTEFEMRLPLN